MKNTRVTHFSNLSNSVAILTYEALRQNGFPGLSGQGEMAER